MQTLPTGNKYVPPSNGFTLLEMLIVLLIIATVSIGIVAISAQVSGGAQLREASMQLMDDLNLLRIEATLQGRTVTLAIISPGSQYELRPLGVKRSLPHGVTISFIDEASILARPNGSALVFYPSGVTRSGQFLLSADYVSRSVAVSWPSGLPYELQ